MHRPARLVTVVAGLMVACVLTIAPLCATRAAGDSVSRGVHVDVRYHKLDNGLRVVLAPDPAVPLVDVVVAYGVGFRVEPRGQTGFAHLFEHLMFQGTRHLSKTEFASLVGRMGGRYGGTVRLDHSPYALRVPAHALQLALWSEADRMAFLELTAENLANQQAVVANEVLLTVKNRPLGAFPWLDMPQHAYTNWYNAHNFYGELADIRAATLEDAKAFYERFYRPDNAVLVVTGDVDVAPTLQWIERYFGPIPRGNSREKPDVAEPPQTREKWASKTDALAPGPALAFAYRVPRRNSDAYYAMAVLDQMLIQGADSLLHRKLVQEGGDVSGLAGGINYQLGNLFDYSGPMLWTVSMMHDRQRTPETIMQSVDGVLRPLQRTVIEEADLQRAKTKLLSRFYGMLSADALANTLAAFALFDDDPSLVNRIEARIESVTAEAVRTTARTYLAPTQRTVLTVKPGTASPAGVGARP